MIGKFDLSYKNPLGDYTAADKENVAYATAAGESFVNETLFYMIGKIFMFKGGFIIENQEQSDIAMKVSKDSILINMVLAVFKLFAGIAAHSVAMISDAAHTFTDVLSTLVVIIGIKASNKKADQCHPYGHERFECVAAIVLAVMLFFTGLGVGYEGVRKVILGSQGKLVIPGVLALIAAVLSIAIKEWMFWFTKAAAVKIDSGALMADAWHHRSDSLASACSFIGIFGARLGFPILDPIACLVTSLLILKAGYDIFKENIDKMVDKSCGEEMIEKLSQMLTQKETVCAVDSIKTRLFASKIFVDIQVGVDKDLTLVKAVKIAEEIKSEIERSEANIKCCTVHVRPF